MQVAIGCKVRFLNDVGGGEVSRFLDKRTAIVKTFDGFEIPTLISELVVVEPASDLQLQNTPYQEIGQDVSDHKVKSKTTDLKRTETAKETVDGEGDDISLIVALVPSNPSALQQSNFDLFLVNDSTYRIFYVLSFVTNQMLSPLSSGILQPDTKILVKQLSPEDVGKLQVVNLQAIYFKNITFKPFQPEYYEIELNPIKLYKRGNFVPNDFFDTDAYIVTIASSKRELMIRHLTDKAISDAIRQKDKPNPVIENKKVEPEIEEVDLHIHQLVDNWNGLTPGEILKIQMARFETALEGGLKSTRTKRMIFIHGVGNGKLKFEITKLLSSKYPKLRYQDASFKEYGFGATMVFLR